MATPTTTIDALPAATVVTGAQLVVVQETGVTKKATMDAIVTYVNGRLTITVAASAVSALANPDVAGTTVQAQLTDLIARVTALEP
jgi:hypothetical protein